MSLVYSLVQMAFEFYEIILIARIILSWVNHDPYHPLIKFIYRITDPLLEPLSRLIPPIGMIDISPIAAFFILRLIRNFLLRIIENSNFIGY